VAREVFDRQPQNLVNLTPDVCPTSFRATMVRQLRSEATASQVSGNWSKRPKRTQPLLQKFKACCVAQMRMT